MPIYKKNLIQIQTDTSNNNTKLTYECFKTQTKNTITANNIVWRPEFKNFNKFWY